MEVQFLMIARYAEFHADGSTTIIGGGAANFPAAAVPLEFPTLYVVGKIILEREEARHPHGLRVRLTDPDGEQVFATEDFPTQPHEIPADRDHYVATVSFGFNGFVALKEGRYHFHLLYDGEVAKTTFFRVVVIPPSVSEPAPAGEAEV